MFRLLPSLGLFVACMTIVLAIPSSTVQHPVDGIVGASNVDGPSGHASFRLHPRSPSIPERCVQHESYVRLEESIKNAQITDPELDFDYWLHQRAPTALHPGRLQLKPAEEAALKMELDSFWEAFRFAGFSMPPGQWTVRARDICINAFKRGFESGAKLANLLYPEDWAGMFERGFHRRPTDVFDIIWTERDRQARQAYVAGTKEFKKFSGTHSEGNIHLRCLEKGRLTRRLDSTPEQQEGILRGQQNGLRVGVCNRKMKEQWEANGGRIDSHGPTRQQRTDWMVTCLEEARKMYPARLCGDVTQPVPVPEDTPSMQDRFMSVLDGAGRGAVDQLFAPPTKPSSPFGFRRKALPR